MNPRDGLTALGRRSAGPRRLAALVAVMCGVAALSLAGSSFAGRHATYTIGVLASSPQTDTWNSTHIAALKAVTNKLGAGNYEIKVVDNLPFGPQMTQTTQQFFQQGADLVVDLSSAGPLFYAGCKAFPEKHCLELFPLGEKPPNTSGWWTDAGVMEYLEGIAAGMLTKNGRVGFVNAFKIPAQIALVNQFALGCQSVRKNCRVNNVYINSFSDPAKSVEATRTLIGAGVDVINYWVDTTDVLTTAATRNIWSFGLYFDQRKFAPKRYVTTFMLQPTLERIFEQELRALANGTWKCCRVNYGTRTGLLDIGLGPWGANVPPAVKAAVTKALAQIKAGKQPFAGPIYDSSGKLRVPRGKHIDWRRGLIFGGWNWPVRGVIGG